MQVCTEVKSYNMKGKKIQNVIVKLLRITRALVLPESLENQSHSKKGKQGCISRPEQQSSTKAPDFGVKVGACVCETFDDQREVSILEGCWGDAHSALVVGVVDPLVSCREHVHHPLHGVVGVGPVQVPVHHPLSVPHPVPGPHHAAAHALQHDPGPGRSADVVARHHYTAAAVRLAWHCTATGISRALAGYIKESWR